MKVFYFLMVGLSLIVFQVVDVEAKRGDPRVGDTSYSLDGDTRVDTKHKHRPGIAHGKVLLVKGKANHTGNGERGYRGECDDREEKDDDCKRSRGEGRKPLRGGMRNPNQDMGNPNQDMGNPNQKMKKKKKKKKKKNLLINRGQKKHPTELY